MIDEKLLKKIIEENQGQSDYRQRVHRRNDLYQHAYGDKRLLMQLLEEAFPSEPPDILGYRRKTLQPITETYFSKILRSLNIIRNSSTFSVEIFDEFIKDWYERLHDDGIVGWFFEYLFKYAFVDANAVVVVMPNNIAIYESQDILYIGNEWNSVLVKTGEDFFVEYSKYGIENYQYNKKTRKVEYYEGPRLENPMRYFFPIGGNVAYRSEEGFYVFDSILKAITPFWNDAIVQYSDKKAGIKQHMFPLFWTMSTDECPACKGSGQIRGYDKDYNEITSVCGKCSGEGTLPKGMFSQITVRPKGLGGEVKLPPAGYVEKDFSSIEFLNKDIRQNIYDGFAAVNMEFLYDVPLNQSGVAKEVDRREFYAFVNEVGQFCTSIINKIFWISGYWYFDRLDTDIARIPDLMNEFIPQLKWVNDMRDVKEFEKVERISNRMSIRRQLVNEIPDPEDLKVAQMIIELDPLAKYSTEEKIQMYKNGLTDKVTAYISLNIEQLVKENIANLDVGNDFVTNYQLIYNYAKIKQEGTATNPLQSEE